jgi:hypothetical protein
MKSKAVLLGIVFAALMVPATYAGGVSQETRDACWRAAQRVSPILTEPEKEAYVANCIANATAGTPPPKKESKY